MHRTVPTATLDPALGALRAALVEHLPWSPHDYVDGLSIPGDREAEVERLLRPLAPEQDLRFVHADRAGHDEVVLAEILPWDSEFFGYRVARLNAVLSATPPLDPPGADRSSAVSELVRRARTRGVRYLFSTVDPRDVALMRALGASGFSLIETRVHQHRSLVGFAPAERFAIRRARPSDLPLLEQTAREMVNAYDRFHADPFIPPADADRLMSRWVRASVTEGFADATYVPDHSAPEAFCTTRRHEAEWGRWGKHLVQPVVLGAVAPSFKGWYRKLISEICCLLAEEGGEHAYFVTQITNRAALRSVEALGFRIGRGEHIFRIVL